MNTFTLSSNFAARCASAGASGAAASSATRTRVNRFMSLSSPFNRVWTARDRSAAHLASCRFDQLGLVVADAVAEHGLDVAQFGHVLVGLATYQHDVGALAGFQGAAFIRLERPWRRERGCEYVKLWG